ncbi:MAG: phosphoglucomutase/phosphomannomutase family protein [Ignavibacteriae bacterium]|nr:phosphoglucomutase/phosphomannomutase family protein [Ignavibacteriota bacterium]
MVEIKFGTDGWRGIIGEDFTFENVEKVALAFSRFYKQHGQIANGVVVGGDARFGSQDFAERVAQVIAGQGIKVWLCDKVVSTPMVSLAILKKKAAAGVMITASHNPPRWNGFKIKGDFGGSALVSDIKKIERILANIIAAGSPPKLRSVEELRKNGMIASINVHTLYLQEIRKKIDLKLIEKSGMKIAYDVMYGAAYGVMKNLLPSVVCLHDEHNPGFKGTPPEPLAQNLPELIELVKRDKYDIGIVTDGDADRLGAVDENGTFISTQLIIPILLKYLHVYRKQKGSVVKTISVSDIVGRMTEKYGLKLYQRPVGFKYVTELMITEKILIGGEESGGVGTSIHIPERDGIFNCLLLCEYLAKRKMTLGQAVAEIYEEFGRVWYDRIDFHTTEAKKKAILNACDRGLKKLAGLPVLSTETVDGYKFRIEGGWLLIRASGTEPILRFYAEADSEKKVKALLAAAVKIA